MTGDHQWRRLIDCPHALSGDSDGAAVHAPAQAVIALRFPLPLDDDWRRLRGYEAHCTASLARRGYRGRGQQQRGDGGHFSVSALETSLRMHLLLCAPGHPSITMGITVFRVRAGDLGQGREISPAPSLALAHHQIVAAPGSASCSPLL